MSSDADHRSQHDLKGLPLCVPDSVKQVLCTLEHHGYEAYLVGGCVRDLLLGRTASDYDVTTNARPKQVLTLFSRVIPTGIEHGTVTVVIDQDPIEVTTYRIDADYSDGRHPDAVLYADNLTDDLIRRDFTMNAIAMDPRGRLVDPTGGQEDLQNHLIRAVGDAKARFAEDGLRILRALRFAAELSFQLEPQTHQAMLEQASRLSTVSMERVGQELKRIANSNWLTVLTKLAHEPYLSETREPLSDLRLALTRLDALIEGRNALYTSRWRKFFFERLPGVQVHQDQAPFDAPSTPCDRTLASVALWLAYLPESLETKSVLLRSLAWSKTFVRAAVATATLLNRCPSTWSLLEWREARIQNGANVLCTASALADFLNVDEDHVSCRTTLTVVENESPLLSPSDLALRGEALARLGFSGPQIGHAIRKMVRAVLADEVTNDEASLVEFVSQLPKGQVQ